MGGDGGLQRTPCISNVSLRRDVSLHYVAEKPDSVGSVSRGSPGQVEAHTDGIGARGVNVQKSVGGDGGLHRTPCTSNVSLRPGSSNQSVSDSDPSEIRDRMPPRLSSEPASYSRKAKEQCGGAKLASFGCSVDVPRRCDRGT